MASFVWRFNLQWGVLVLNRTIVYRLYIRAEISWARPVVTAARPPPSPASRDRAVCEDHQGPKGADPGGEGEVGEKERPRVLQAKPSASGVLGWDIAEICPSTRISKLLDGGEVGGPIVNIINDLAWPGGPHYCKHCPGNLTAGIVVLQLEELDQSGRQRRSGEWDPNMSSDGAGGALVIVQDWRLRIKTLWRHFPFQLAFLMFSWVELIFKYDDDTSDTLWRHDCWIILLLIRRDF